MKYVSSLILVLTATAGYAQVEDLKFDASNLQPLQMVKEPKSIKGVPKTFSLKSPVFPIANDLSYPEALDAAHIEQSLASALEINDLPRFVSEVTDPGSPLDITRHQPRVCPSQMVGAALRGTYARDFFGINYPFPGTGSSCVTQPSDPLGLVTCPLPSSTLIAYQVCDYHESVSDNECDLLNTVAGYGSTHSLRYMRLGSGSGLCQKFTNYSFDVLQSIPRRALAPIDNLKEIRSGENFSCARRVVSGVGELYCWGDNQYGQLGLGTVGYASTHAIKVRLPGSVRDFSVSYANVCAVLEADSANPAGSIYCWGRNDVGQLNRPMSEAANGKPQKIALSYIGALDYGSGTGDYMNYSSLTPFATTNEVVKQISIGAQFINPPSATSSTCSGGRALTPGFTGCFVTESRTAGAFEDKVYCWGNNTYGQVATGRNHNFCQVQGVRIRQAFYRNTSFSNPQPNIPASAVPARTGGDRWAANAVHVAGTAICILGSSNDSNLSGKVLCAGSDGQSFGILGSRWIRSSVLTGSLYHDVALPLFVDVKTVSGSTTTYSVLKDVISISANEKIICAQTLTGGSSRLDQRKLPCWGKVPGITTSGSAGTLTVTTAENLKFGSAFGSMAGSSVDGILSVSVGDGIISFTRFAGIDFSTGLTLIDTLFIGYDPTKMMGSSSAPMFFGEPSFMHPVLTSSGVRNDSLSSQVRQVASGTLNTAHECHIQRTYSSSGPIDKAYCAGVNFKGQFGNGGLDLGDMTTGTWVPNLFPRPSVPVMF